MMNKVVYKKADTRETVWVSAFLDHPVLLAWGRCTSCKIQQHFLASFSGAKWSPHFFLDDGGLNFIEIWEVIEPSAILS